MPVSQTPASIPSPDPAIAAAPPVPPEPVLPDPHPPVVAAPPVEPEPLAEAAFSLREAAQQRGIDPAGYESDESLAEAMFSTLDTLHQNEPFVKIGQQFAPYADKLSDFQAWQAEQTKAAQPTPTPAEETPGFEWDTPEYDPRWEAYPLERDERGFYKAPADLPAMAPYAEKMNAYQQDQRTKLTRILSDPQKLIQDAMGQELAALEKRTLEAARAEFQGELAKQHADAEMNAYVQQQEADLYQHAADGQTLYDAQGYPQLSVKGRAMAEHANMLETAGVKDPKLVRQLLDICLERDELSGRFSTTTPAPTTPTAPAIVPPTPQLAVPKAKRRFLNRLSDNNRGGSVPDPTAPEGSQQQSPDATMADITRRIAREQGVTLS